MIARALTGIIVALSLLYCGAALGFGLGKMGAGMGYLGAGGGKAAPAVTGKILLVDGVSHLLQVDGVSKICLAGGC